MNSVRWGWAGSAMLMCRWSSSVATVPPWDASLDDSLAWTAMDVHGIEGARRLIGQDATRILGMRSMLAKDGDVDVSRLADSQVLDRVAARLVGRRWIIFHAQAPVRHVPAKPSAASVLAEPASTAIRVAAAAPAVALPRARTASAAAPAVEEGDFASADQDHQAERLRAAAAQAIPLYEICRMPAPAARRTA